MRQMCIANIIAKDGFVQKHSGLVMLKPPKPKPNNLRHLF